MQKNKDKNSHLQMNAIQNLNEHADTETPPDKKPNKSRSKYDCSPKLKDLIDAANLLPKKFHFDLIEASEARVKEYEHLFIEPNREEIEYSVDNIDAVLEQSYRLLSKWKAIDAARKLAYNHTFNWYMFFSNLPDEVKVYLMQSEEVEQFYKDDSYSYWENNEDYAAEQLDELLDCEEITKEEYQDALANDVASLLVEKGYYGESWSYREQKKEERDYWSDDEDERDKNDDFYFSIDFAHYAAYHRLEETRDFIHGLVDLQEKIIETKNVRLNLFDYLPEKLSEDIRATKIKINENGEIRFSISERAEILQGVEITRVRKCEVCEKIFWATRKDAFACSKQHSKVRQMRLLRQNWKEKGDLYLKARKKSKKKGANANGTL